ncbi:arsinothricin resistance N-acetyltransferase ArsN1 family A [Bacillus sp. CECT 9360]|uniref:arsinothricin resistance N-acetyltransferase ArsN1 family A n=1 Tax=Bacillus sp. CECT 9360 TaxID=2845821 RepID=UPI001E43A852|nr:arsinothricin resistance N-acetyltransferase ArsN1 family A [Bacillus sp. CECT 9360]CAH0344731.1 L-methionine sulfoximine/L-methionine sulfone acetyltransferase [Bacillus sp. CECT 9360]
MGESLIIREAELSDVPYILDIYNQGIEDHIATLETEKKDVAYMNDWFNDHQERYKVIVAELGNKVVGWASLNPYNNRCAYAGVADLSIYINRDERGKGIGKVLLSSMEEKAMENQFHKIVLFTFPFNALGQNLYRRLGYQEVGVFKEHGILEGKFVDVLAMEKIISQVEDKTAEV